MLKLNLTKNPRRLNFGGYNTKAATPTIWTQTSDMILKAKKAFLSYWRFSFCILSQKYKN